MLEILDGIGKDFPKSEFRQYIIDVVSKWVSEREVELSQQQEEAWQWVLMAHRIATGH
jgi:hypothetical protein